MKKIIITSIGLLLLIEMLFIVGCANSSSQMFSGYASDYVPEGDENNPYFDVQKYNYDMDQEFMRKERPLTLTYIVAITILFPYEYLEFSPIIYTPPPPLPP